MNVENDCTVNDADNEDGIDAIQADNVSDEKLILLYW